MTDEQLAVAELPIAQLMEMAANAKRYQYLREHFVAANFQPESLDLAPGVALIFVLPAGVEVSSDLDETIDGASA